MSTRKIFKFPIRPHSGTATLWLSAGYRILKIDVQNDCPTLWADVDLAGPPVRLVLEGVMTGREVPKNGKYLDSLLLFNDSLVVHYYSIHPPKNYLQGSALQRKVGILREASKKVE